MIDKVKKVAHLERLKEKRNHIHTQQEDLNNTVLKRDGVYTNEEQSR
jgi:hypothetical protein